MARETIILGYNEGFGRASMVKPPFVAMAYWRPVLMMLRKELCGVYAFRGSPRRCLRPALFLKT